MWDVTVLCCIPFNKTIFLLTHPVWDVTGFRQRKGFRQCNFYSHIPCGMWQRWRNGKNRRLRFLLTHPVWDVTPASGGSRRANKNFYSHIPCGMWLELRSQNHRKVIISTHTSRVGCDNIIHAITMYHIISTHTSRVGCDPNSFVLNFLTCGFLLTHPVWDVTFF